MDLYVRPDKWCILVTIVALLMVSGCANNTAPLVSATPAPVPTLAPILAQARPTMAPPPTPRPVLLAEVPAGESNGVERGMENLAEVAVFGDTLADGWSIEQSSNMPCNPLQQRSAPSGAAVLACAPRAESATLFFTVTQAAREMYRRDRIVGVSFYLSSDDYVATDALSVAMQGSVRYPYWAFGDMSASFAGRDTTPSNAPFFSETPLYFLGVNRDLEPSEWTQVILWLDNQIYDPDYTYVTGFYLKTDRELIKKFYIDDIALLVQDQGQ